MTDNPLGTTTVPGPTYADWQTMSGAERQRLGLPQGDLAAQFHFDRFAEGLGIPYQPPAIPQRTDEAPPSMGNGTRPLPQPVQVTPPLTGAAGSGMEPVPSAPPRRSRLPATDAGFGEVASAAWTAETVRTDAWDYMQKQRAALTKTMFDLLSEEARRRIDNRKNDYLDQDSFEQMVMSEAQRERRDDPALWADYPASQEQFDEALNAQRQTEFDEAQRILDQPGGGFAEFMGSSARAITDRSSLVMLPFGVQGGVLKTILGEAALGAVGGLATVPREQQVANEMGLPDVDPVQRAIEGAVLGGGLASGIYGLGFLVVKARAVLGTKRAATRDATPTGGDRIRTELEIGAQEARLRGNEPVSQVVKPKGEKPTVPATGGDPSTVEWQRANLTMITSPNGEKWQVNRAAAADFKGFLDELAATGYVIKSSGGYNYRNIRGSNRLSEHATGNAIDINAVDNPMGSAANDLPPNIRELAAKYNLEWGGDWSRPDPMHFQWRGNQSAPGPAGATFTPTTRSYTQDGQVRTGDGTRIDVNYEVVDATSLIAASGDMQPRDRTRIMSDVQIANMAARLDPALLMPSPFASYGTPIVGPDNIIESGNGRTAAIIRAYELHPDRAAAYRAQIEAAGYAIPEGVTQPILVARRTSVLTHDERIKLAIDAQNTGVAQMTPTEVARASSRAMTVPILGRLDPSQPLTHEANGGFVSEVLAALPETAVNAMIEEGSKTLNAHGARLLREALFARAWPDPDILARFAEGAAGQMKSLLSALNQAAPSWAALKADIEAGLVRPEMDISGHVTDAMRLIMTARDLSQKEGLSIASALTELLDDIDMEFGPVAPLTGALVRKFWRDGRTASADDIATFLSRYADEARTAGATGTMFDGPSPRDILAAIDPAAFGKLPDDMGQVRGYARPPAPVINELPAAAYDQGAASPEAMAADAAIAQDLVAAPLPIAETAPSADAILQATAGAGPRQMVDLQSLPPATADALLAGIKKAQPYDSLDPLMQAAAVNHDALNDAAAEAAAALGLEFKRAPLKEEKTVVKKVTNKYAGNYRKIGDVARSGITAPTIEAAAAFVKQLGERFHLIDEGWITTPAGYFDQKLIVRFDDGQMGELQVWPPGMLEAKSKADLTPFGGYPETYVNEDGETKAFVGGHKLYEIARDPAQPAGMRAKATADMQKLYGDVAATLDPSFAEKLGIGAPIEAKSAAVSEAATSTALSSPSTATAIGREPPTGAQAPSSSSMASPASDMAQTSDPSLNNFMGSVPPSRQDIDTMQPPGGEVNRVVSPTTTRDALTQLHAEFGNLVIDLPDGSSASVADILNDLNDDTQFDAFVQACALGGVQ